MNILLRHSMRTLAALVALALASSIAVDAVSAQPLGPGASDRLRSFSTDDDPSNLERIRAGMELGGRDWVEATRRLANQRAATCLESEEDAELAVPNRPERRRPRSGRRV